MKWQRWFSSFSLFVRLFFALCVLGLLANIFFVVRDLSSATPFLRLHIGFGLLYLFQIIFILLREKWVCVLTLLQGILALLTTHDFAFVPVLRFLGQIYYFFLIPTVESIRVYKYIVVSLAFTLQLFSAYALFVELRPDEDYTQTPPPADCDDSHA
ncbi:MAG: hypothetical protein J5601_05925 [Elusimicrobiaceae bacterium]|nr:hypothetical protein [Elusimicrobiaceae bacterium]